MNKAVIAMSGGVDSSVAAYLIKEKGYGMVGVTLKLFDKEKQIIEEKSCCNSSDIEDAKKVAKKLGIEHEVFNFSDDFNKYVINKFISDYENARTPNPCIECNRHIKFKKLLEYANDIGYKNVVTGHYARIEKSGDRYLLKKGIDEKKDQSYVLYSLTKEQLRHIILPLGSMSKDEVRKIAADNGFINARKKESQDICFIPDGDYASFIEGYTGKIYPDGDFVNLDGEVLGTHKGIIRYTIGQRKGLNLSLPKPMYVCKTDIENNRVILGDNCDLFSKSLDADNINLIACDDIKTPIRLKAKIRYSQKEEYATVVQTDTDSLHIEFDNPQRAITSGQAVVLYDGDTVVGGGVIR